MRIPALLAAGLILTAAARADSEKDYVLAWAAANHGKTNVSLADRTRCDVVTATHAVEVVFAARWQNAVGQALYHATQLNKQPGIVLIMEGPKDAVYRQRLDATLAVFNLPIQVWEIPAEPKSAP